MNWKTAELRTRIREALKARPMLALNDMTADEDARESAQTEAVLIVVNEELARRAGWVPDELREHFQHECLSSGRHAHMDDYMAVRDELRTLRAELAKTMRKEYP